MLRTYQWLKGLLFYCSHSLLCLVLCLLSPLTSIIYCLLGRCFAALGDVAKAGYLRETHELAKQKQLETVSTTNAVPSS